MTLSMPATVISVSGSVRHMRPLPSLSTMQTPPVSAIRKFAPLTAVFTRRNFSRRKRRAASARSCGVLAEVGQIHLALKISRICWRFLCSAGTTMCEGWSWPSWMISSARSVS